MHLSGLIKNPRWMGAVFAMAWVAWAPAAVAATAMVAQHSFKCVDVPGASPNAGVGLQQWTCNGTPAQRFNFVATSDGFYQVSPESGAGLCLQSAALGSPVTQQACSSTANSQKWSVSQTADGTYQVKTRDGAGCLNLSGANSNDGAALITWACGTEANMRFQLDGFGTTEPLPHAGKVTTLVATHSGRCVDVSAGSTSPGSTLVQWACHGGINQDFQLVGTPDGFYQLKPRVSGLCLDSGSAANGTRVLQQTCGGASSQKWKVQQQAGGAFTVTTANGNSCLDIADISTADGAAVTVWECVGGANQAFHAPGLGGTQPPPPGDAGDVMLVLQGQSGANLFWEDGRYDTSFGHLWGPMLGLTGLSEEQLFFEATPAQYTENDNPRRHSIASATSTYTVPGSDGQWLNPSAPGAVLSDPTTWGNGVHGRAIISFLQQKATLIAADRPILLLRMHSEYDSTLSGSAVAHYPAANREAIRRWRQAAGRTAALMPVFYVPPPFLMGVQEGSLRTIRTAWAQDTQSTAMNAYWGVGNTSDSYDRNDLSHWTKESADQAALRLAVRLSRWLWEHGYTVNELSWLPTLGPRITEVRRVSGAGNQLDFVVQHDKGTDLIVPASPNLGAYVVMDNGTRRNVTSLVRLNATTLRATLNGNLTGTNSQVSLDYGLWTGFDGMGTHVTDNWHTLPRPAWAANVSHLGEVRMVLQRSEAPLQVR
jgi:hypothetical protein